MAKSKKKKVEEKNPDPYKRPRCEACKGSGWKEAGDVLCPECNGSGRKGDIPKKAAKSIKY